MPLPGLLIRFTRRLLKRARYFPLLLISAAVLGSMAGTYWLTNRTQNERRHVVLSTQGRTTAAHFAVAIADIERELRSWAAMYLKILETVGQLRPDLNAEQRRYYSAVAQPSSPAEYYDVVVVVDATRRILAAAAGDGAAPGAARSWLQRQYTETLPGSDANDDWLGPVLDRSHRVALGWRKVAAANDLNRRGHRSTALETSHVVFAVPIASATGERFAAVGVVRWSHFQTILDRNQSLLREARLPSGYAYLIDADGDTVIGHQNTALLGQSLEKLAVEHSGLEAFRLAVRRVLRTHQDEIKAYDYPGRTAKAAYLHPFGTEENVPDQLRWVLGVGADDGDLRSAVRADLALFLLPSGVVALGAACLYLFWAARYRATFSEALDTIKHAKTLNEVDTSRMSDARYNQLIEAAGALIARSRARGAFTPIPNPYVVGRPISDGLMFYGRQEELSAITQELKDPGNELIILAGQRRIGKTSLLYEIRRKARGSTCVFIDSQRIAPGVSSDADLYRALHKAIAREVDAGGTAAVRLDARDESALDDLDALLDEIHRRDVRLVLLVDEFESLEELFEKRRMTQGPLTWLAAQLDGTAPFSMVATGSEGLQRHLAVWGTLRPKARRRKISFLSPADTEALIRRPLLGYATFVDGTVDAILRVTGCHPLMTQDFCYRLVSRLNETRVYDVTLADVEAVSKDLVENAPTWIEDAWTRLPDGHQLALRLVAMRLPGAATFGQPAEALEQLPPSVRKSAYTGESFQETVNSLLDLEWLQKNGTGYRFRCDLHRRWISEYHPLTLATGTTW